MKEDLGKQQALLPTEGKMLDEVLAALREAGALKSPFNGSGALRLPQTECIGEEFQEFADAHILIDSRDIRQIAERSADGNGVCAETEENGFGFGKDIVAVAGPAAQ